MVPALLQRKMHARAVSFKKKEMEKEKQLEDMAGMPRSYL
jgi:hypothetical protein